MILSSRASRLVMCAKGNREMTSRLAPIRLKLYGDMKQKKVVELTSPESDQWTRVENIEEAQAP
jgi:hypothetical protein